MLRPSPQPDLLVRRLVIPEEWHSQPQQGEHQQLRHGLGQTNGGCTDSRENLPACSPSRLAVPLAPPGIGPRGPALGAAGGPSPLTLWAGHTEGGTSFRQRPPAARS